MIVKETKKQALEKPKKVNLDPDYLIIIKKKEIFYQGTKYSIKVKHFKDNHVEAVVTCKEDNVDGMLNKMIKTYRRLGTYKIIDLRNEDNQGHTEQHTD